MNLLYGEDKFFIGAVKFFDVNKDFGFIASNNCNMPTSQYKQDFYVNSASFTEVEAKKDGCIVVFQVEKQKNGKTRAVNVRRISKSDDDINLALNYYGEHEYVDYKDRRINLYNRLYHPRKIVAEKVKTIIIADKERSPKRTALHFKFFVEHYKQDMRSKNRYIFDRDFSCGEKSLWVSLFSVFTDDERLEILKLYPTAVRYIDNEDVIYRWLNEGSNEDWTLYQLQEFHGMLELLPNSCLNEATTKLEVIADKKVKEVLAKLAERSDIGEAVIERELYPYLRYTAKTYDNEKNQCLASIRSNRFKKELQDFISQPTNSYRLSMFLQFFNRMSIEEQNAHKQEMAKAITPILENYISNKSYRKAVDMIHNFPILDEIWSKYTKELLPLITDFLNEEMASYLNSGYGVKSLLDDFRYLTIIFCEEEKNTIRQTMIPSLLGTKSLYVLSQISYDYKWVDVDTALAHAKEIISTWDFNTLKEAISRRSELFDESPRFGDIVIERALKLIENVDLSHFFDGTSISSESSKDPYSRNPERENCMFLKHLKENVPGTEQNDRWNNYIQSRSPQDLMVMFDKDVIPSLPESLIKITINSISLEEVYDKPNGWYHRPTLNNQLYIKALRTTSVDLFPLVAERLMSLGLSDDNIPLAVLLTEIMTINKQDYQTSYDWEQKFKTQLTELKKKASNAHLSVILWAVHFRSSASMQALSEIFGCLPPYVQIRSVKKLFQLMSQGKISYTAENLYNLILSKGNKPICFPLEIAFAYLKLREKDPSTTLNNNVMLQLLEGRDDHADWIGIRQLVTECEGRWIAEELPDDYTNKQRYRYFNGLVTKTSDGQIKMFVPNRMIDEYGNIKEYNNKYYGDIVKLIKITYADEDYKVANENNGVSYYFDESHEPELFAIARPFNMKFNGLDNFISFVRKEDGDDLFCECRLSNRVDNWHGIAFYWCGNKPCFRPPVRYMLDKEWEQYTLLDFMRILKIPADYVNRNGKRTMFGHYIILSSYLKSFAKFYEHLKCRGCGKLMKPYGITNFTTRAVNEFSCANEDCAEKGKVVYLNHCFNKRKCNATIDSRDSKQCPNKQYICPECGACCSTENFRLRINHLQMTGGRISEGLLRFVYNNMGHWERQEFFCYKCGKPMTKKNGIYKCEECGIEYDHS